MDPLRNLESIGAIDSLEQNSNHKVYGSFRWVEASVGDKVFNGDLINTDERSSTQVSIGEGVVLDIGPETLIRIEVGEDGLRLKLTKGQVKISGAQSGSVQIVGEGGEVFEGSGTFSTSVLGLHQGEDGFIKGLSSEAVDSIMTPVLDLTFAEDFSGTIALYDGNGNLVSESSLSSRKEHSLKTPLPGRYTIILKNPDGSVKSIRSFTVAPFAAPVLMIEDLKETYIAGDKLRVSWSGQSGHRFKLRVRNSSGVRLFELDKTFFDYPVETSGSNEFEVSLLDRSSEYTGKPVSVALKVLDGLLFPEKQFVQTIATGEEVEYTPLRSYGPLSYEVSKTPDFQKVKLTDSKITFPEAGEYFVRAKDPKGLKSRVMRINVQNRVAETSKDFQSKQILKESGVEGHFKWIPYSAEDSYRLEVSETKDFRDIILAEDVRGGDVQIRLPKIGKFWWRLVPIGKNENLAASKIQSIELILPRQRKVPEILSKQIIYYKKIDGKSAYQIKMKEHEHNSEYFIEVYSDEPLKRLIWKASSKKPFINWVSNRTGKYFYRVKIKDQWGRMSRFSKRGELIFPISPMEEL